MIELFLDKTKVYIASSETIKLSRENPYITSSGDYTLDVQVPLSILNNRQFFGPWHRLEKRKKVKVYTALLYANNICVLNGSAKVTEITNETVKLQLYGDRSEFNAVFGEVYIDELSLPYVKSQYNNSGRFGGSRTGNSSSSSENTENDKLAIQDSEEGWSKFVYPSLYNEAADSVVNVYTSVHMLDNTRIPVKPAIKIPQYNLLFVVKSVFAAIGYELDVSDYDVIPYNHLIIANCLSGAKMSGALPHWTIKEFVQQLQYFFGCVFIFSSASLTVKMTQSTSVSAGNNITVESEDSFTIEVNDEDKIESAGTSDLHYSLSDSEFHDTDYIDEDKIDNLPVKVYESYDALLTAYEKMSSADKGSYLLRCPQGDYCQWVYQGVNDTNTKINKFIHVNQFGDLIRNKEEDEEDNSIDLKICPVAIAEDIPVYLLYESGSGTSSRGNVYGINTNHPIWKSKDVCYQMMPSMEGRDTSSSGTFGGKRDDSEVEIESTEIQDLIQSDGETASYTKPDRIELFYWDGAVQQATKYEFSGDEVTVNAPCVFTAWDHKNLKNITHEKWSMALNVGGNDVNTMSKCHNEHIIDQTERYTIKFLSNKIPSASDVFIIKNKRFFAEKIEIELKDGKMNPLMTGTFLEIQ